MQRAVGQGSESGVGPGGPEQGWGLSCSGAGGQNCLLGEKQWDADICIRKGAGHEVTPTPRRKEAVNQGMVGCTGQGRCLGCLSIWWDPCSSVINEGTAVSG